jgi:hypothetical protein
MRSARSRKGMGILPIGINRFLLLQFVLIMTIVCTTQ